MFPHVQNKQIKNISNNETGKIVNILIMVYNFKIIKIIQTNQKIIEVARK